MKAVAITLAGLVAAVVGGCANAQRSPDMEAAHQYASCLGATSASADVATGSIDVAIKVAFQSCAPLRKVAVTEITKGFQVRGMKFVAASKEAEDFVQEMDQQTAKQLRADIAALRAKKQVSNAPNQ